MQVRASRWVLEPFFGPGALVLAVMIGAVAYLLSSVPVLLPAVLFVLLLAAALLLGGPKWTRRKLL